MMGKVIDFTKFLSSESKRRLEKGTKLPSKYSVRMRVSQKEEGYLLEYDVSNKKVRDTVVGREMLTEHLMMIILNLCEDDPSLILELYDTLAEIIEYE